MRFECLVFDIDDTLYLERDYVRSGFAAVDAWLETAQEAQGFALAAWNLFQAGVRGNTIDRALRSLGMDPTPDLVAEAVRRYREHHPQITLLEDVSALLDAVSPITSTAVVSDGFAVSQRAKVRALGLDRWMDPIVLTDSLPFGSSKPSPAGFLIIEQTLSVRAADCVYVGDNPAKDFVAPASLGWATVRVRRASSLHSQVESGADVHTEVRDFAELGDLLELGQT